MGTSFWKIKNNSTTVSYSNPIRTSYIYDTLYAKKLNEHNDEKRKNDKSLNYTCYYLLHNTYIKNTVGYSNPPSGTQSPANETGRASRVVFTVETSPDLASLSLPLLGFVVDVKHRRKVTVLLLDAVFVVLLGRRSATAESPPLEHLLPVRFRPE